MGDSGAGALEAGNNLPATREAGEPQDDRDNIIYEIQKEGIGTVHWFLGISGTLFFSFFAGRWPQHLWVVLFAGYFVLPPIWFYKVVKYYKGALFALDLCWVMNAAFAIWFALTIADVLTDEQRMWCFRCFFVSSTGFLAGSVIALSNSLIFYSYEKLANLWIHYVPGLVCLLIREGDHIAPNVEAAWPGYFKADFEGTSSSDLFLAGTLPFLAWWVPFTIWLVTHGVTCPERGCNTVYGGLHDKVLGKAFQRIGIENRRLRAAVYMLAEAILAISSFGWGVLVWRSYVLQIVSTCIPPAFAIWTGSSYYMNVTIKKYGPMVKQAAVAAAEARENPGTQLLPARS